MTTLYRDDEVVVTSTHLRIGAQSWRLSELEYVWHRETRPDWRVRGRTAGRGALNLLLILSSLAGLVLLVSIISAGYLELKLGPIPTKTLIVLAVVLLLSGFIPVVYEWALNRIDNSYIKGDAIYEMWARIHGTEQMLLRLPDERRFSSIYRALQRALEPD
jgi:Family of unknown function (DUF6232)